MEQFSKLLETEASWEQKLRSAQEEAQQLVAGARRVGEERKNVRVERAHQAAQTLLADSRSATEHEISSLQEEWERRRARLTLDEKAVQTLAAKLEPKAKQILTRT